MLLGKRNTWILKSIEAWVMEFSNVFIRPNKDSIVHVAGETIEF